MSNKLVARNLAEAFIARSKSLHYKGKRRDDYALEYFIGAAKLAEINGNVPLYQMLAGCAVMLISVRGFSGIEEIAAWEIKEEDV